MIDRDRIMAEWDRYRAAIAAGDRTSLPRDWFEAVIDYVEETATAAECERCAKVVDDMPSETGWIGKKEAASKIRAANA